VTLRILVEGSKHDGQNSLHVITYEIAEVLVVPEIECPFCNLEERELRTQVESEL
jgi:hypothetical protein